MKIFPTAFCNSVTRYLAISGLEFIDRTTAVSDHSIVEKYKSNFALDET